jgi:uncharacterized protein (DUF885 family)
MTAESRTARPRRPAPAASGSVARFRAVVHDFYEQTFQRFPDRATEAGRHEFDDQLGRPDPAAWERQIKLLRRTILTVEDLPPQDFDAEATLDRRAFLSNLRLDALELDAMRTWAINPRMHLFAAADALHVLFIRHADDLTPVAGAMIARLSKVPAYLDHAAEGLARPDPRWQHLTADDAHGVAEFFASLAEPLARASGQPIAALKAPAIRAAAAAHEYARHVGRLRPGPQGSFAVGEERLRMLIHERLGLCYSPRELVAVAHRLVGELREAMRREARRFHPRKSAAEVLHEAAMQWDPGDDLVATYRQTMAHIRARFDEAGWVTFPKGERLLVKAVPEFMRKQFPTAAYSAPGPLDPDQTGIFWVNDLGSGSTSARARAPRWRSTSASS